MRRLLVVLLPFLVACRGVLARGEAEFKRARYPSAKQVFASLEEEMRTRDVATRAEYALYRGLTLAALGDRSRAALWLHEAKDLEDQHGGTLRPDDARRLAVAMEANEVP
jgi:hypothetical protein